MSETTETTAPRHDASSNAEPSIDDAVKHTTPAPPPSPPPARGPRLRIIALVMVASLLMLWIGMTWGDDLKSGLSRIRAAVSDVDPDETTAGESGTTFYTCGMHPWVILPKNDPCPICQMDLTPVDPSKFTGEITVDPTITQSIGVRIQPVTTGPLITRIRTVGTIDFDETTVRDINIKVPGWIEAVHVDYLGAEVSAGDPLFEFYSPELYAAQEEFLLAHRNRDQIGADFMPKAAEGAQHMLGSARTRLEYFDVTPGQIDALAERGTPAKTMTMYSPFHGVVIAKNANEGLRVDQGTQVYRIADLSKVWGMVTLYEYQLPYVQVGQQAKMTLPYIPGHTFNGEVIYIYPYLDKATRQVNVRLEFDNHDGLLKPGMYANVELENRLAAERVLAPRSAIIDTGERQVAFVSLGDGKFEPRDIRMGIETLEGQVEILDGLRAGEMVVTSGQFLLDSEAKIREGLAKMIRGDLASGQEAVVASAGASELSSLPDDAATALRMLLGDYFTIGDTLAGDSADGLDTHARNVARAVDDMLRVPIPEDSGFWNRHDEAATIRGKALELIEVKDIEAARLVFADLSVALSKLTRATGIPTTYDAEVHELHCPMYREGQGGSIWLQPKGSVRNPFYGAMMLECFDERSVIPVTGAAESPSAAGVSGEPDADDDGRSAIAPVTITVDSAVQLQLDAIHTAYVSFHDLLTKDETDGLRRALEVIAGGAAVFSSAADPDLKAFGERLTTATHGSVDDLESARAVFEQVSTVLMELWAVAPPSTSVAPVVYQVYCPMVKKSWLQTDREVANPYAPYMLRCGSIKSVVAGTAPGGESR